jgi:hypothetical protein
LQEDSFGATLDVKLRLWLCKKESAATSPWHGRSPMSKYLLLLISAIGFGITVDRVSAQTEIVRPSTATAGSGPRASEYDSVGKVNFSKDSRDALEQIRALHNVVKMGQAGKLVGPFLGLFTSSGASRLLEVWSISNEDWETLATEAQGLGETERKTVASIADNTLRELKQYPKSSQNPAELAFWKDMNAAFTR